MTMPQIENLQTVIDAMFLTREPNAIEQEIIDQFFGDSYYSDLESLARQLEMAHCAAGSFSGLIYTRDILDKLKDEDWQAVIIEACEEYLDATGETVTLSNSLYGHQDTLSSLVTFAVDWTCQNMASRLRAAGPFYVVTDSHIAQYPEKHIFTCYYSAQDWIAEKVEERVQESMEYSGVIEKDGETLEDMREAEFESFKLEKEFI